MRMEAMFNQTELQQTYVCKQQITQWLASCAYTTFYTNFIQKDHTQIYRNYITCYILSGHVPSDTRIHTHSECSGDIK